MLSIILIAPSATTGPAPPVNKPVRTPATPQKNLLVFGCFCTICLYWSSARSTVEPCVLLPMLAEAFCFSSSNKPSTPLIGVVSCSACAKPLIFAPTALAISPALPSMVRLPPAAVIACSAAVNNEWRSPGLRSLPSVSLFNSRAKSYASLYKGCASATRLVFVVR